MLRNLNASKAMGPDGIHLRVLKELAPEISEVMAHFFQQSINSGTIPNEWKNANICPLFKKNDRSTPSNYRPVSLTVYHEQTSRTYYVLQLNAALCRT